MKRSRAEKSFAALGHGARLNILRLLIGAGEGGLPAGEIGAAVAVTPSRLSFHLNVLEQAGLVTSRRKSRNFIYAANYGKLK
ncbi:MAG: ArsR/SmtB family transcription factor, partial [Halocynthiibacter sp.]